MKFVTLFFPELFNTVETMVYFLASDPGMHIRLATSFDGDEKSEHPWALRRIREFGGVEVVSYNRRYEQSHVLAFYLARDAAISSELKGWRAGASSTVYLSRNNRSGGWRDVARELVRSFPHYLGARRIEFAPYIHPGLMANRDLLAACFSVLDPEVPRRWRVGFLGNRQPPERARRLAQCREALVGSAHCAKWHEYGGWESSGSRGIEPAEYIEVLSQIDFCLSPPGYDWYTHRTVEALVRGAIPILEDPDVYELGLVDGENCLVAARNDWSSAVKRALRMADTDVLRMRRNVFFLRSKRLTPQKASERFNSQLRR